MGQFASFQEQISCELHAERCDIQQRTTGSVSELRSEISMWQNQLSLTDKHLGLRIDELQQVSELSERLGALGAAAETVAEIANLVEPIVVQFPPERYTHSPSVLTMCAEVAEALAECGDRDTTV